MTNEQAQHKVIAITFLAVAAVLIISAILTIFELSDSFDFGYRRSAIYGIVMLVGGIICTGAGFIFLLKADVKIGTKKKL